LTSVLDGVEWSVQARDNIKTDNVGIEYDDLGWIYLAQDRDQQLVVMDTVMN
jgi:hypothetical protein